MHSHRQPAPFFQSFRTLAGVASACVLLLTSPIQAATPYPTVFDRVDAAIEQDVIVLRKQREAIEALGIKPPQQPAMQAFMENLRSTMLRVHEELLPSIRQALNPHLHSNQARARQAEREAGSDVGTDQHIAHMRRVLVKLDALAEFQQWHLEQMQGAQSS